MKKLNLNQFIKVKFTDLGKDIYYHQFDSLIEAMESRGIRSITPSYPRVDKDGYSSMQLWCFIELYGPHIGMCKPNVIEDLNIYIDERDLDEVDAPLEAILPLPDSDEGGRSYGK